MASYVQVSDLYSQGLPQSAVSSLNPTVLTETLESVSRFADTYLRAKYPNELIAPYPRELVSACAKIAAYDIMCIRGYMPEGTDSNFKDRRDQAVSWLKQLSAGTATLSIANTGTTAIYSPNVSTTAKRGW